MNTKKILLLIISTLLVLGVLNVVICVSYQNYNYKVINNVVSDLVLKYPELEEDIIDGIFTDKNSPDVLYKYGIKAKTFQELADYKKVRNNTILITVLSYIIIGAIFFLIYIVYILKIKREVKIINSYLNEILKGSYDINIADYNEDELAILKNDIYKVAIKLKELSSYEHQERVYLMNTLEDISHQLKTPLTALMVMNDILKDSELTKQERKDFLNKETRELEKMEWLITTLLKYSKLDSGMIKLKRETINLNSLIDKSLESLLISLELKEIRVVKKALDFDAFCDINWTSEAITNILKNAIEHLDSKGEITITGDDTPLGKRIYITDNGCGISKKEIKNIFKRFYSSNNTKNSVGIGLNMAKLILEKEQAKIEVESVEGEYTTFIITFAKHVV